MSINTSSINEVRKKILRMKREDSEAEIVVQAQDDGFNRKILENSEIDVLLNPHLHNRRDYMKQRDSGMNEVTCKLAKKNGINIGIDLNMLKRLGKKQKAVLLARIKQNIQLCKRIGTKIIFIPGLSKQERMSFVKVLGGSTEQGSIH